MGQSITFLQINDVHAYLEPHPELFWSGKGPTYRTAGGYARVATLFNAVRARERGAVLALDGGDTFHGTYAAVHTHGEALVPILNALGLGGMVAHWDFAYGPDQLRRLDAQLNYPVLAANCYHAGTDQLALEPYRVLEIGGLRVGVIGLAAVIVDKTMPPHFSEGLSFTLGVEELPGCIRTLRDEEQVDLVVVLSHLGFPQEHQLAQQVDGIDVLLGAHTHHRLRAPVVANRTLIIQSGSHGSFVGCLTVEVEQGRVVDYRHELIPVDERIEPDREVAALVEDAVGPYRALLAEVVGQTSTGLDRGGALEATMDNFLLQGLLHAVEGEVAFSNGWRYGAPIPAGPVTLGDLWNIIPVNPPISTATLTGAEIVALLEESLEHTYARDPYRQMGGYLKRCLGLSMTCKIEDPYGQRVREIFVRGEPLQPEREYRAVYVTAQGVPRRYGRDHHAHDVKAIDALRNYLAQAGPVEAGLRGTVVAI